ncbi:MAG TPA: flavin reductase [Bordetella sp.]
MDKIIAQDEFRDAVSRLGAAVHVVTTNGEGGLAGFTASAVCSLTDTPAMLLVCLQKKSSAYESVKKNGVVCVNMLGSAGLELCKAFSGKTPMADRFADLAWKSAATGSPVLPDSMIAFDCTVTEFKSVETHEILLCQVREIIYGDTQQPALIYYNRAFHHLN